MVVASSIGRPGGGDYEASDRAAEKRSNRSDLKLLPSGNMEDMSTVLARRISVRSGMNNR